MSVAVEGVLARDAMHATWGPEMAAVIVFQINAGKGQAFEIRHRVGTKAEDHIKAESMAAGMRRGAFIQAACSYIESRIDHGDAVFVMREPISLRVNNKQLIP